MVGEVATATGTVANMKSVVDAARDVGIRIVVVSCGGTFHDDLQVRPGDLVVAEHWAQSGFTNTDLDQQCKQHDIGHVVVIGLLANTSAESTARSAMELGYHVTLVTDATAAASTEAMHATHSVNGPTYTHAIVTAQELTSAFSRSAS